MQPLSKVAVELFPFVVSFPSNSLFIISSTRTVPINFNIAERRPSNMRSLIVVAVLLLHLVGSHGLRQDPVSTSLTFEILQPSADISLLL